MAANPAAVSFFEVFTAGVYAGRRFMLPDIQHMLVAAGLPLGNAGIGAQLNCIKAGAFTQSEIGIAYAKKLGRVSVGIRFNYHKLAVQGYGSAGNILVDVGSIWELADNLYAGVRLYNPARAKIGEAKLNYIYTGGLGYEVSPQLLLCTEISKEENKPPNIIMAVHYEPAARVLLQAGIATGTAQPFVSAAFKLSAWRLLMSVSYHTQLGCSPALAFTYKPLK